MNLPHLQDINEEGSFENNSMVSSEKCVNISLLSSVFSDSSNPLQSLDVCLEDKPIKPLVEVHNGRGGHLINGFACKYSRHKPTMTDSLSKKDSQIELLTLKMEDLKASLVEKEQENSQMKELIFKLENRLQVANPTGNMCGSCSLF